MIALFTDFGWRGPYVGEVHAVLARDPGLPPVIDLMHDAPRYDPRAAAHLLAALVERFSAGTILVAVVDPGVGTERRPLAVEADGRWLVGPDNGLLDVVSARADSVRWWQIGQAPETGAATFHGRDLFAPVAARIARGESVPGSEVEPGHGADAGDDLAEVIYTDGFGNAMTGLRGPPRAGAMLAVADTAVPPARTFADVAPGEALWFMNSIGLVEIAVNRGSAVERLALGVGEPVRWHDKR